ncbi:MAG: glycosyltransferase [Cyclobacteriaceae bacterium]
MKTTPLLFLSLPRHDEAFTSTPWQLAVTLAKSREVFFCDAPYTWVEALKGILKPAIRRRWAGYFGKSAQRKEGVTIVVAPFILPSNFLPAGRIHNWVTRLNEHLVANRVNRVLAQCKCAQIDYINSFCYGLPLLFRKINPAVGSNVYHCIDPMVKQFTLKHGPRLQMIAAAQANVIVVTSPSLAFQFNKPGLPPVFCIPNAANVRLFEKAQLPQTPIHASVRDQRGKILGYLGNIERRIDATLLVETMNLLPDWQLIMAGPVDKSYLPQHFLQHPRIIFTGPCRHDEAPGLIKRFDVAIIPFLCDEVSSGIYPLKLYEYLAAGKPVVCTNFNPAVLNTLTDVVSVVHSAHEFAARVDQLYLQNNDQQRHLRTAVAGKNTWQDRAATWSDILSKNQAYGNPQGATPIKSATETVHLAADLPV